MSYNVKFTDKNNPPIEVAESAVSTQVDIALFGRKKLEYGQDLNANLLHILENFASFESMENPGTPDLSTISNLADTTKALLSTPLVGQLWWNKTQNCMFSYDGTAWNPISMDGDISVNWGAICDGEQIPLPVSSSGYIFSYAECVWIVSPKSTSGEFEYLICSTNENATVTMQYGIPGGGVRQGIANFMIVAIRDNFNLGSTITITPPSPTVTPTVTPSTGAITLTPTPTPTVTGTESVPITPTPTPVVTGTPAVTPTVTGTPGVSITPTPAVTGTPAVTPTRTGTPAGTPPVTPTVTPTVTPSGVAPLSVAAPSGTLQGTSLQPASANAGVTISSDGTVSNIGDGSISPTTWLLSGSASDVEVSASFFSSGGAASTGGPYNTWLSMSSSRLFGARSSALGRSTATIDITFRDATTLTILSSGTIDITLTVGIIEV